MKKLVWFFLVFLFFFCQSVSAQTQTQTQTQMLLEQYDYEVAQPDGSFRENTRRILTGETNFAFEGLFSKLMEYVRTYGTDTVRLLLKVVAVGILFAVLTEMQHSFGAERVRDAVFFVGYLVISGLLAEAFGSVMHSFESAVDSALVFINGSVPILCGLLITGGKGMVAAAVEPVVLTGCVLLSNVVRFFIVPLLYCVAVLSMVSGVSKTVSVNALAAFVKKIVKWGLCLLLAAFSGLLAVQGFGAGAMSALQAKTARYVVSNAVPVVGGLLSDTLDALTMSARAVRTATGVAGLVALFGICIVPVVRLGLTSLLFQLAAAVMEPVADRRVFSVVSSVGEVIALMLGVLCAVFVMLVICISMLMRIG